MTDSHLTSSYNVDIRTSLCAIQTDISIAEIHGILTGIVCAGINTNGCAWVDPVMGLVTSDRTVVSTNQFLILHLYHLLSTQLNQSDTGFQLVLDDCLDLHVRARSLSDWCCGFIAGLRIAGVTDYDTYCAAEPLYHCTEIARLDHDSITCSRDDTAAFENVVEYVRLGAILVHGEFSGGDTRQRLYELRHMQPFRPAEMVVH